VRNLPQLPYRHLDGLPIASRDLDVALGQDPLAQVLIVALVHAVDIPCPSGGPGAPPVTQRPGAESGRAQARRAHVPYDLGAAKAPRPIFSEHFLSDIGIRLRVRPQALERLQRLPDAREHVFAVLDGEHFAHDLDPLWRHGLNRTTGAPLRLPSAQLANESERLVEEKPDAQISNNRSACIDPRGRVANRPRPPRRRAARAASGTTAWARQGDVHGLAA